jgi:hypothetical protein
MKWTSVIVLLVIAYLGLASPISASAFGATPTVDEPPLLVGLDNLQDAAIRAMQATRIKQSGPIVLTFEVLRFTDAEAAEEELAEFVRRVVARFDADRNGADPYQPATDAPEIGDETIAYIGEQRLDEPLGEITATPVAILFVRTGAYIHLAIGIAFRGDPLPELVDTLAITTTRTEGERATPTNEAEHRTGGLWDLLPELNDVPPGFEITDEIVPEPFAPSPDQSLEMI